jgi:integrase
MQVGTVEDYRTKAAALKAVEHLRVTINNETRSPRSIAELVSHYKEKELGDTSSKAYSTRHVYGSVITTWIVPKWGERCLSDVKTVAVEEWLGSLELANGTKAKIRNIMSALFNHAMRHEWMDKNPISLVRQSAKRERIPDVLDVNELKQLLSELKDPYRTMVFLAATTGLRASELLALKWQDIDCETLEITLTRGIVHQVVGDMKTEASRKPIALDAGLAEVLMDWRGRTQYNQSTDWVFASPEMEGVQPYWPDSALRKILRPAAVRAGIKKHIGWHTFRHTYGTILKSNGEDVKTVQESLRHANSRITLDTYTQAVTSTKRAAQGKVVQAIRAS